MESLVIFNVIDNFDIIYHDKLENNHHLFYGIVFGSNFCRLGEFSRKYQIYQNMKDMIFENNSKIKSKFRAEDIHYILYERFVFIYYFVL